MKTPLLTKIVSRFGVEHVIRETFRVRKKAPRAPAKDLDPAREAVHETGRVEGPGRDAGPTDHTVDTTRDHGRNEKSTLNVFFWPTKLVLLCTQKTQETSLDGVISEAQLYIIST